MIPWLFFYSMLIVLVLNKISQQLLESFPQTSATKKKRKKKNLHYHQLIYKIDTWHIDLLKLYLYC